MDMQRDELNAAGLSNPSAIRLFREHLGPGWQPPQPHYIDTTQQPEDYPDRSFEESGLVSSAVIYILFTLAAAGLVHLHFSYGFPF
jgi:hypothetical protein